MTHQVSNTEKLRVITRRDLPIGTQSLQSAHAAIDFQHKFPSESTEWHKNSNYLVFLTVEDEKELINLIHKVNIKSIKHTVFYEPDLDNQITAIALEPSKDSKKVTSSLPLLGKEVGYV